jgi:hypothetical protein
MALNSPKHGDSETKRPRLNRVLGDLYGPERGLALCMDTEDPRLRGGDRIASCITRPSGDAMKRKGTILKL